MLDCFDVRAGLSAGLVGWRDVVLKNNDMNYPQDFIDEVKAVYPDWADAHKMAANGNAFLGRLLDDASCDSITVKEILEATSLDELKKKALILKRKFSLYQWWGRLYDQRRQSVTP